MHKKFFYVIEAQFLGYRYHGWQKQKDIKTVQHMLDKTIEFFLPEDYSFKTLPASRTDKMVSAQHHLCELYLSHAIAPGELHSYLNDNLPGDIKVLKVSEVSQDFQIMGSSPYKEYYYFFSWGKEKYPFSAPFLTIFKDELNLSLMQEATKVFIGEHNFKAFCYRPQETQTFVKTIFDCGIKQNDELKANFFPPTSFIFHIKGSGFLRHQVRIMMGALVRVGIGEISIEQLKASLKGQERMIGFLAPPSGLLLKDSGLREFQ